MGHDPFHTWHHAFYMGHDSYEIDSLHMCSDSFKSTWVTPRRPALWDMTHCTRGITYFIWDMSHMRLTRFRCDMIVQKPMGTPRSRVLWDMTHFVASRV